MGPQVEALVKDRNDTRLIRINIEKWGTPVAEQFKLNSIPQLRFYEGERLVSSDRAEVMRLLRAHD